MRLFRNLNTKHLFQRTWRSREVIMQMKIFGRALPIEWKGTRWSLRTRLRIGGIDRKFQHCVSPSQPLEAGCCGLATLGSMDLPRMPSNASLSPSNLPLLSDLRSRQPISRKLLSASNQEPSFAVIPSASNFQPSRKREEARALQNLRRRVQALKIVQSNRPESIEASTASKNSSSYKQLDNRPQLLQKVKLR